MIKLKFNNRIVVLDNIQEIGLVDSSITFNGDMLSRFQFKDKEQAELAYRKIFGTEKNLDFDEILSKDSKNGINYSKL